jgi:hypothetical protein
MPRWIQMQNISSHLAPKVQKYAKVNKKIILKHTWIIKNEEFYDRLRSSKNVFPNNVSKKAISNRGSVIKVEKSVFCK